MEVRNLPKVTELRSWDWSPGSLTPQPLRDKAALTNQNLAQ